MGTSRHSDSSRSPSRCAQRRISSLGRSVWVFLARSGDLISSHLLHRFPFEQVSPDRLASHLPASSRCHAASGSIRRFKKRLQVPLSCRGVPVLIPTSAYSPHNPFPPQTKGSGPACCPIPHRPVPRMTQAVAQVINFSSQSLFPLGRCGTRCLGETKGTARQSTERTSQR